MRARRLSGEYAPMKSEGIFTRVPSSFCSPDAAESSMLEEVNLDVSDSLCARRPATPCPPSVLAPSLDPPEPPLLCLNTEEEESTFLGSEEDSAFAWEERDTDTGVPLF